jgi:uncharacterized membrane protein YfcA
MLAGGIAAGAFGSILGLGGGLLIVPLLTLGFGLPLREAVGVSLVCVIVTSSASAGVYLQRRQANLRLGMVLELFTAAGAVVGGAIAFLIDERLLAALFALLLVYVAVTMLQGLRAPAEPATDDETPPHAHLADESGPDPGMEQARSAEHARSRRQATSPELGSGFVAGLGGPGYEVKRLPVAALGSVGAGIASALLGIGGGLIKVPLMHLVLGVPLRVATATSNLMIGITASASAIVYLIRGGIDAYVAGPTAVGVFVGASLGSRLGHRVGQRGLRLLFVVVLVYTAIEMVRRAAGIA